MPDKGMFSRFPFWIRSRFVSSKIHIFKFYFQIFLIENRSVAPRKKSHDTFQQNIS
jgi:hypothetical protein